MNIHLSSYIKWHSQQRLKTHLHRDDVKKALKMFKIGFTDVIDEKLLLLNLIMK